MDFCLGVIFWGLILNQQNLPFIYTLLHLFLTNAIDFVRRSQHKYVELLEKLLFINDLTMQDLQYLQARHFTDRIRLSRRMISRSLSGLSKHITLTLS